MNGIDYKQLALSFHRISRQAMPELITITILICAHYILELQFDLGFTYINIVYAVITFPCGYSSFFRTQARLSGALLIGFIVGVVATACMTAIVSLVFHQEFFPDQRQVQDFAETSVAIMLAYGSGNATANFISYLLPNLSPDRTAGDSVRAIWLHLVRLERGRSIAGQINSIDATVKAMVALVMTVGTLLVAIKKLLVW
jgi:hypothetical protein